MTGKTTYENPLTTRYASRETRELFAPDRRYRLWRELWIALARAQMQLGLDIREDQIEAMQAAKREIDYDRVAELERDLRHDVMAHLHAFAEKCPAARPILHLGATSCYVTDNADLLLIRDGLDRILAALANVIDALADLAERYAELPTLGFTHFQPAQPVTVGKRACLWLQDALLDLDRLEFERRALRFRGVKGTTGTQASFLDLFGGDEEKVRELDRLVAKEMGFDEVFPVTGQTYPRKVDYGVLSALSGIGQTAHRFANDIRLLMHREEVEEPFTPSQVGSSAMPYKRNPMRTERMTALSRYLISLSENAAQTAAEQWLERTLDDSANRRISLPQAFLAADAILVLFANVVRGLTIHEEVVRRNLLAELPFLATERILMLAVTRGGDRQTLHERLRVHAVAAKKELRRGAAENDLLQRIRGDETFSAVRDDLEGLLDPKDYVGRAPAQVREFLAEHVRPRLAPYEKDLGREAEIRV